MSKIKNGGLDESGAEPFKQQQFGTAGVEAVKVWLLCQRLVEGNTIAVSIRRDEICGC